MKAVILDYQTLVPNDLDMKSLFDLPFEWELYDKTEPEQTLKRIDGADIILTNKVVITNEHLGKNQNIKLLIILATGTNNVHLDAAKKFRIPVCNISGYSTESVAQHTFACLLELIRKLSDYRESIKAGKWSESPFFCMPVHNILDLSNKTIGIIGYGDIGKRVHELASAFQMNVLISESLVPDRSTQKNRTPFKKLLRESDVVSIHCPLSPYSKNLINNEQFSIMKNSAILLNMARGGIVDEHALMGALKSGQIQAAATDVLTEEPPSANHILLQESLPNLLITPHIAWASRQARQNLINQVYSICDSFKKGIFVNRVV